MEMPFGSFLSQVVTHPLGRLYLQVFGWPVIGARVNASTVLPLLDAQRGEKILDAGCGFGLYSFALAKNGVTVVGVDFDEKQILMARQWAKNLMFPNVRFEVQNICKLPYEDESFDKILCVAVMEHVPEDERAFSELVRVLKDGGILVLAVATPVTSQIFFIKTQEGSADGHVREGYTPEELFEILESKGLLILEHRYCDRFFERFAYEINTTLLRRAGGLEELKKAYATGSISTVIHLLPVLLTFPPLFILSKLDSITSPTIRKNVITVKAKKPKAHKAGALRTMGIL